MQENLSIALVQADTRHASVGGNLAMLEELLENSGAEADLYLFPELFNTGYANSFVAKPEHMGQETTRWMRTMATRLDAAVCGSAAITEAGKVYNRMLFVSPDGNIQHYDKQRVFRFSGEDKVFSPGLSAPVFKYQGWRIKPIVCFDLRFPEVARNQLPWYDVLLCSAHWPQPRIEAWDKLLLARAIENQAYVAAVNRVGVEGDSTYPGHSAGIDFAGNILAKPADSESVTTFICNKTNLETFRNRFPFLEG